jgi:hypothetical protein
METFKSLLQELDATLRQFNMPAYENLLPPLPDEEIDRNLKELGIEDEDVKALFQWKSGMRDEDGPLMMEFGGLITFDSIKSSIAFNKYYDPLLKPLISDNGEEMLLFNTKRGPHYGKLYLYSVLPLYIDYLVSYYDSLTAMVNTIIDGYKDEALVYDEERDWLDEDSRKFDKIAKNYNKNCVFWTDHDEVKPNE